MIVVSGFMGIFIHIDKTYVGGNPATYVYTENFDADNTGIVVNESNPDEVWYDIYMARGWDSWYVSTSQHQSGAKSLYHDDTEDEYANVYFDLNGSSIDLEWFNVSFFLVDDDGDIAFGPVNDSYFPSDNDNDAWAANVGPHFKIDNDGNFEYYDSGDQLICSDYIVETWVFVNVTMDYVAHTSDVTSNINGSVFTVEDITWRNDIDNASGVLFRGYGPGTPESEFYIDDFMVGSNTDLGSGIGDPSIDDTAFFSSLSYISGQYCITFEGEPGGILWCNSSGEKEETMDVYIKDGDSDVDWVNVSLWDVSSGSYSIDAEDFGLAVSVSPSSGFHDLGNFPVNGGNITLDADVWIWTSDPFPISGDDHLYYRFYVNTAGYLADYYNIEAYTCSVYIGGD